MAYSLGACGTQVHLATGLDMFDYSQWFPGLWSIHHLMFHSLYGIFFIISLFCRPSDIIEMYYELVRCRFITEKLAFPHCSILVLLFYFHSRCFQEGLQDISWNSLTNLQETILWILPVPLRRRAVRTCMHNLLEILKLWICMILSSLDVVFLGRTLFIWLV